MRLLDLCARDGGATWGYMQAGFEVIAVDIEDHSKTNPAATFVVADALQALAAYADQVDAVHTSPPCQRWSQGTITTDRDDYVDLLSAHRQALEATGLPYVIENVPASPLRSPVILCGTHFNLRATDDDGTLLHLRRHRRFETNWPLRAPLAHIHPSHVAWAGAYDGGRKTRYEAHHVRRGGYTPPVHVLRNLMGIDWMGTDGLYQAIPPAYTRYIGTRLARLLT